MVSIPASLEKMVKAYTIKSVFLEESSRIQLPQFHLKLPLSDIFGGDKLLEKEELLQKEFKLSQEDTKISFQSISSELYKVDLDETNKDHTPSFVKIDGNLKESILSYILDPSRKDVRVKNFTKRMMDNIGSIYPIADIEIKKYIQRVLEEFTDEQFTDMGQLEYS